MSIFGLFFFIIIFILILGVSVVGSILRTIFGFGKRKNTPAKQPVSEAPKDHKKVFDKNEGEYVEFEEIKEE